MATGDQIFDLFSLDEVNEVNQDDNSDGAKSSIGSGSGGGAGVGMKAFLENLPELWDESQYTSEYNTDTYSENASARGGDSSSHRPWL